MKKLKNLIVMLTVLSLCLGLCSACTQQADESSSVTGETPASEAPEEASGKKLIAALVCRTLGNSYEVQLSEGAKMFAEYQKANGVDVEVQIIPCDSNSEKQINDIKALCAKKNEDTDVIFVVMANENPLVAEIADICESAGVYWANLWNLPEEGLDASQYPHWVLHSTPDDYVGGKNISESLIQSFATPGKGKMVAVLGIVSTTSSIMRYKGLEDTLPNYPDVELLDVQAGDFDPQKSMNLAETWLAKYQDLDAIWCANDDMATGVISALKNAGLNGKIQVCGVDGTPDMLQSIKSGDADSTVDAMPILQAGYSLAYCYAALTGEIDASSMTKEEKMVYTKSMFVNSDNIDEVLTQTPEFDFSDLSFPISGPITQ